MRVNPKTLSVALVPLAAIIGLATISLPGCKHPLAIIGEGDIVEVNNTGRGCTLEQFRAGDAACTENEVTGDYFVNYKAVPRPGWRFVRWEGPCAEVSDFQHCRLEFHKEAVDWWDATYPDAVIPPSTAVFEPMTGNTGHLVAGAPVAGVAYQTPTQQGVTGLDGSFQYAEGETVRFTIGATVLGEVVGREQVSPFDLAACPVITGLDITWALQNENDPFHAAINLAILLQTLDHDATPGNGIEIRAGVAALLRDVPLDIHQAWYAFQEDVLLHHAVGRANRTQRFSQQHGISKPADALDAAYRMTGTDPGVLGLVKRLDVYLADNASREETWQYDAAGNVVRHANTHLGDGFETWQYDQDGNVIQHEEHSYTAGHHRADMWQYDANGRLMQFTRDYAGDRYGSGRYDTTTYTYDEDGNRAGMSFVISEDGATQNVNSETYAYAYHDNGKLMRRDLQETFGDHTFFETEIYDESGNVIRDESNGSTTTCQYNAKGQIIESNTESSWIGVIETWQYDSNGNVTRHEAKSREFEAITGFETWQYGPNGNLTRYEDRLCGLDEERCERDAVILYQYDERGQIVREEKRNADTAALDEFVIWQYNELGKPLLRELRDGLTGELENFESWQYDDSGNLALWKEVRLGDGRVEYTETRQYHSNGNLAVSVSGDSRREYNSEGYMVRKQDGEDVDTWEYDGDGTLLRHRIHQSGEEVIDILQTFEYENTGWGHLFSGVKSYGHDDPPPEKPN